MRAMMTSYLFEVAAVETHVSVEGGNVLEAAMTQLALHRLRLTANTTSRVQNGARGTIE